MLIEAEYRAAVVGGDIDIELRDGRTMPFTFAISNKPVVKYGEKEMLPAYGVATISMADGIWKVDKVELTGARLSKVNGKPIKQDIRFTYVAPFDGDDPDYAAPDWLITFITKFENRLSGTVSAKALDAARQIPEVDRADFNPTGLRILRDLVPNPEALDAVLRIVNPQVG